jgi:aspartate carbamoyltransferase catalytic subunit
MRSFNGRDILSLKEFGREEYFRIFEVGDRLAPFARDRQNTDLLAHKTLVTAFYQPSTRTRLAHEAAMHRLGGHVLGFSDAKMTRAGDFYQESIKDTVRMLEFYGDAMVMRHFQQGAPHGVKDEVNGGQFTGFYSVFAAGRQGQKHAESEQTPQSLI